MSKRVDFCFRNCLIGDKDNKTHTDQRTEYFPSKEFYNRRLYTHERRRKERKEEGYEEKINRTISQIWCLKYLSNVPAEISLTRSHAVMVQCLHDCVMIFFSGFGQNDDSIIVEIHYVYIVPLKLLITAPLQIYKYRYLLHYEF